jgi:hypothetical protein
VICAVPDTSGPLPTVTPPLVSVTVPVGWIAPLTDTVTTVDCTVVIPLGFADTDIVGVALVTVTEVDPFAVV